MTGATHPLSSAVGSIPSAYTREFRAHGHGFVVRSNDASVVGTIEELFAGLGEGTAQVVYTVLSSGGSWSIMADGEGLGTRSTLESALNVLLWHCNRAVVASLKDRVVLHAAGVSRQGRGLVLAAPMGSGKTTLAAGLVRSGFDYLTDEALLVESEPLRTAAYAKPLSLAPDSLRSLADLMPGAWPEPRGRTSTLVAPGRLRPGCVAHEARPEVLLFPKYDGEGDVARLERVSPAAAVGLLAASTFGFSTSARATLPALAGLAAAVPAYTLTFSDVRTACSRIEDLITEGDSP